MRDVSAALRRAITGGTQSVGGFRRWRGVAVAGAAAALFACATGAPPAPSEGSALRLEQAVAAGLDLYEAREFAVAAERFQDAAREAKALRDTETLKTAVTAECASWLRAVHMPEFAICTERLAKLHRHSRRPDPGLGVLLAMGAIAGDRSTPPYRIPAEVAPLIRAARHEGDL